MGTTFWLKRFLLALAIAAAALSAVRLLRGDGAAAAVVYGALWGGVAAAVYTLTGYARFRRNPACMLPPRSGEP